MLIYQLLAECIFCKVPTGEVRERRCGADFSLRSSQFLSLQNSNEARRCRLCRHLFFVYGTTPTILFVGRGGEIDLSTPRGAVTRIFFLPSYKWKGLATTQATACCVTPFPYARRGKPPFTKGGLEGF